MRKVYTQTDGRRTTCDYKSSVEPSLIKKNDSLRYSLDKLDENKQVKIFVQNKPGSSENLKDQIFKTKEYFEPDSAIIDPEVSVATIKQRKIKKKNLKFFYTYPKI